MRYVLAPILICIALPVPAWETTLGSVCILTHDAPEASARLTYDPRIPEYSITLTRPSPWPEAPVFALRFDGDRPNMITTDQHRLADGGTSLTVTDRGFGNVLNGLQFNGSVTALVGDQSVTLSLRDAAPAVQAFRECMPEPGV